MTGYGLRRARWVAGLRLRAAWHRSRVRCEVAPDLRLGRRVRVTVTPHTTSSLWIGQGCQVGDDVRIELRGGELWLGDHVDVRARCVIGVSGRLRLAGPNLVQHGCTIHCDQAVSIGDHVGLGEYVTVVDSTHATDAPSGWFVHQLRTSPVHLASSVWVAAKATICRGVHLGPHAVVGANSVVVKDVAAGQFVSGVPARVVPRAVPAAQTAAGTGSAGIATPASAS